jgi:hypothetical protein
MANRKFIDRLSSATAAGSGATNGADRTLRSGRGITFVVKTISGSGTSPTVTVKLQGKTQTGDYYDIPGATTTALPAGTPAVTALTVCPGITAANNAAVNLPVPVTYRLVYTIGGSATPTATFAVDVIEH